METTQEIDSYKLYIDEISKYQLLSEDEVKECYKYINRIDEIAIIKTKDISNIQNLDLATIFKSFCNNENYEEVLKILADYYRNAKSDYGKRYYNQLKKYMDITLEKGRALTEEELTKYFEFDFKNAKELSNTKLLNNIKLYFKCIESYNKMFNSNLRLVVSIAKKYSSNSNDILDLISDGNIGLMKAISKFDISLGYMFSTYATHWIKQSIQRSIQNQRQSIKIPVHFNEKLLKYKRQIQELEKKYGSSISQEIITTELGYSYQEIYEYERYAANIISLDQPISDNSETIMEDFVESSTNVSEEAINEIEEENIKDLLSILTDKEKNIIINRYGLNENQKIITLEEIGNNFNLTKERIRQIESKALRKMRNYSNRKKYIQSKNN